MSHLLTATMIGTETEENVHSQVTQTQRADAQVFGVLPLALLACWMDSTVWFMTPSSAATTRMTMSVASAPRALMAEKAAWPGVSRKVILSPVGSWTGRQDPGRQEP